ncbi:MAG: hypothetical protein AB1644_00650 [Candidatus Zixiibacteriota bacterium]
MNMIRADGRRSARNSRAVVILFMVIVLLTGMGGCDGNDHVGPPTKPPPLYDSGPSWTQAGNKITFTRFIASGDSIGYWLCVVDTLGGSPIFLRRYAFDAVWLPGDSEFIFFSGFKLYKLHLPAMQITLICDCVDARFPELDPTGRYLYYEDQGVADNWATSVYRMDLQTGDTVHIVGGGYPATSPDARYLLVNRHDSVLRYDLQTLNQLSGVSADAQVYDWTADGQSIVYGFFYNKARTGKLYISNADGSNFRYLAVGDWPKCAPSGSRIAISRRGTDNKPYIWLIDQQGGNLKQITF